LELVTKGSVDREQASKIFEFLGENFRGKRTAIREFTHRDPEFVFWIYPDGKLMDAKKGHKSNPPKGYEWILDDEPFYGGFLRGRVARYFQHQLIVVYCRSYLLSEDGSASQQLLKGLSQIPIPIDDSSLIISDNGDIFGTFSDFVDRSFL